MRAALLSFNDVDRANAAKVLVLRGGAADESAVPDAGDSPDENPPRS